MGKMSRQGVQKKCPESFPGRRRSFGLRRSTGLRQAHGCHGLRRLRAKWRPHGKQRSNGLRLSHELRRSHALPPSPGRRRRMGSGAPMAVGGRMEGSGEAMRGGDHLGPQCVVLEGTPCELPETTPHDSINVPRYLSFRLPVAQTSGQSWPKSGHTWSSRSQR